MFSICLYRGAKLTSFLQNSILSTVQISLEDGDVVVNLGSVSLGDALGNPHDIPALLLFQLQKRVEDTKVELLHKSVDVQFDLKLFKYAQPLEIFYFPSFETLLHIRKICPRESFLQDWCRHLRSIVCSPGKKYFRLQHYPRSLQYFLRTFSTFQEQSVLSKNLK